MGTLKFPMWILRELGSGWIAASSTWAVAARNFGLAFMCASLRRDYPHQGVRGCLPPAFSEPAQDPQRQSTHYNTPPMKLEQARLQQVEPQNRPREGPHQDG